MTRLQHRVKYALQFALNAEAADLVAEADIIAASRATMTRPLTLRQVRLGLASLAAQGEVEHVSVAGMGGEKTYWGLTD